MIFRKIRKHHVAVERKSETATSSRGCDVPRRPTFRLFDRCTRGVRYTSGLKFSVFHATRIIGAYPYYLTMSAHYVIVTVFVLPTDAMHFNSLNIISYIYLLVYPVKMFN